MYRSLQVPVKSDLSGKPVFLVGPRQVGRTTLARAMQVVRELRQEEQRGRIALVRAADWLAELAA